MNQSLTIESILLKISHALESKLYNNSENAKVLLEEVSANLSAFLEDDIDFKSVVNALDDSICITDKEGRVIYTNPNYQINTGINPSAILGRKVSDIVSEGKIFTGGAVIDVIRTKRKAFRLSEVHVTDPPQTGYVIGVPIFDETGQLKQVVASSRPILTLRALQEDFEQFLREANALKRENDNITTIISPADTPKLPSSRLIGSSPALKTVWSTLEKAAPTDASVLITGESGVGKEIVSDEIYRMSQRSGKPFIKVNCASIPMNLLESELFGYEKGAFSGASSNGKQGLFEMANGGTLLLDEIGDMPMDLQVKLLRAIQNQEITRVGGTKVIPLDIRFIAATNNDLKKKIAEKTFRQDLYYRLNVIPVHIPPLRERKDDIRPLCDYFIALYGRKHHRFIKLNESHYNILCSYDWPGNIRELENVIEYLTICSPGTNNIDIGLLRGILDIPADNESLLSVNGTLGESLEGYEKILIETALKNTKSLREAGAKLGVNASTISRKIKQYGIDYHKSHD